MDVQIGQVWIDKDPRMCSRAVKVTSVDEKNGWVRYSPCNPTSGYISALSYRSNIKRFPKAFKLHAQGGSDA